MNMMMTTERVWEEFGAKLKMFILRRVPEEAAEDTHEGVVAELAPYIKLMVDSLPADYREALVLTEYEGLTQKELGERLGISLPGAKSRVQRGREKLKMLLLNCCHFQF